MHRLFRFISNLDAKAWRTLVLSFLLFGGVGIVFVLGAPLLGLNGAANVERLLGAGVHGPWAPLMAIAGLRRWRSLGRRSSC